MLTQGPAGSLRTSDLGVDCHNQALYYDIGQNAAEQEVLAVEVGHSLHRRFESLAAVDLRMGQSWKHQIG